MKNFLFHSQKGFVLITVYLVITQLAIFSLAYFARSNAFIAASERNRNKTIAFAMAESGVDFALKQLSTSSSYAGTADFVDMSTNFMKGGFTVEVTTPSGQPDVRAITSIGFAPTDEPSARAFQRSVITVYTRTAAASVFKFAVFASTSIKLTGGTFIDSYNSNDGTYQNTQKNSGANVATNAVTASAVYVDGSVKINGIATIGPGGTPSSTVYFPPWYGNVVTNYITGGVAVAAEAQTYDPVPAAPVASSGAFQSSTYLTTYLPAGTYHYSSYEIRGSGSVQAQGPVIIFVDGDVKIAGAGFGTQDNVPANFQLYVTGNHQVTIEGSGAFYGTIYAPDSDVAITGNGGVYGAVVSKSTTLSGSGKIHFDEALLGLSSSTASGAPSIVSWQEQNILAWGIGS